MNGSAIPDSFMFKLQMPDSKWQKPSNDNLCL